MDFQELLKIMEALRSEKGCPWDKEQTRESLKPFIVEEAYELIEAIDEGDPEKIKEELGDLLFQIVFQCQIAKENNEFKVSDVIEKISKKMIARHPHVFGKADYKTADEVLLHWEEQKKLEGKMRESILEGIPKTLPSLLRAHRLQKRAAGVGFDWEKVEDVLKKLDEELKEFKEALKTKRQDEIEDELGDIFFMLVNISRFIGVNPEDALRKTISKFIHRFRYIEMNAAEQGKRLSDMTLPEMDRLWDEAKGTGK
ncbi:MAG: nucleoside triphosphate pyrophosphohydrolase [Nitrospirae bacterium CG_4_10_14_0_8_um_filter_41_23]|nr:nucleoside triphosphate pyrophosphohydrolase [Nitrospirota bacterium]OIP58946.1 MAG: nucleoside triphosphate pyrophosphohydrolase [Nitrospirae bacterium CG2_30_41_42]PIQ94136.1 MAG: nucleoside triphosphate pyrophosphohydrolase [Nitrospirae bacterium CG11_big_fil_rev_8_21_14_0_20_41_14]PIV43146.1 MAG: nucleoside triphosphate pyrophosphohydrolase [Nitrospirae bacterium CG02_land_8_20_14_3_00_41_53]PIW87817.1 MAG: nucleoside triphosphate pyrophosphohydrolase [Nitrospirae bacterium CG_4_8_14_3_u